jgi:hypothetical protein
VPHSKPQNSRRDLCGRLGIEPIEPSPERVRAILANVLDDRRHPIPLVTDRLPAVKVNKAGRRRRRARLLAYDLRQRRTAANAGREAPSNARVDGSGTGSLPAGSQPIASIIANSGELAV